MRSYTCPRHRNTCCRCGRPRQSDAGRVLAWVFAVIFFALLLFWPAMALHGMPALYVELTWLGGIAAVVGAVVLTRANSPEIREREKNSGLPEAAAPAPPGGGQLPDGLGPPLPDQEEDDDQRKRFTASRMLSERLQASAISE